MIGRDSDGNLYQQGGLQENDPFGRRGANPNPQYLMPDGSISNRKPNLVDPAEALARKNYKDFVDSHHFTGTVYDYERWSAQINLTGKYGEQITWISKYAEIDVEMRKLGRTDMLMFAPPLFNERLQQLKDKQVVKRDQGQYVILQVNDWDTALEAAKLYFINQWKVNNPHYKDREFMYARLKSNQVSSEYGLMNNLNAHYSAFARPVKPNSGEKTTEDYYYDQVIPTMGTIIWWFTTKEWNRDFPMENLVWLKWKARIETPSVKLDGALAANDVLDSAANNKYSIGVFILAAITIAGVIAKVL